MAIQELTFDQAPDLEASWGRGEAGHCSHQRWVGNAAHVSLARFNTDQLKFTVVSTHRQSLCSDEIYLEALDEVETLIRTYRKTERHTSPSGHNHNQKCWGPFLWKCYNSTSGLFECPGLVRRRQLRCPCFCPDPTLTLDLCPFLNLRVHLNCPTSASCPADGSRLFGGISSPSTSTVVRNSMHLGCSAHVLVSCVFPACHRDVICHHRWMRASKPFRCSTRLMVMLPALPRPVVAENICLIDVSILWPYPRAAPRYARKYSVIPSLPLLCQRIPRAPFSWSSARSFLRQLAVSSALLVAVDCSVSSSIDDGSSPAGSVDAIAAVVAVVAAAVA